jgi:flagellar motor switch protein FliG
VEDYTGRQKVAILLMALGEESTAAVTRNLTPDEVEAISFEIARMDQVDPVVVEAVLDEWEQLEQAAFSLAQGGVDYARKVLEKAFGTAKASAVLKRIESQLHDHISLSHLRRADPQQLSAVLRAEHPQSIALILAYLDPDQTAAILKELPPEVAAEVLMRVARMEKVLPDVLAAVESSVGAESDLSFSESTARAGGPQAVAEVLNMVASTLEKDLLGRIDDVDGELSSEIKDLMFVFEDIVTLDDEGITRLLKDVETRSLAMSLKVASEELRQKIMGGLTSRARESLEQEMEFLGPVRVRDVEEAQAAVVQTARSLEEAGEIVIGGSDDLVVE